VRITVIGQRGDGPVLQRTVTPREFIEAWGPWAKFLWRHARRTTVELDGCLVRVVIHA
jgi:hypothetical protein